MGDYKPLLFSLIIIFIIGLSINLISPLFDLDIEEETKDTWIEPFIIILNSLISLFQFLITLLVGIIEGIFGGIITIVSGEPIVIEITGTGTHDGLTLDGYYTGNSWDSSFEGSGAKLVLDIENNTIQNATLKTSLFTFWWFTYDDIYKASSISGDDINLFKINPSFTFNSNAVATIITEEEPEETTSITNSLEDLFNRTKEYTENSLKTFGLIPVFIGFPLVLIILISLFYGIYKLIKT